MRTALVTGATGMVGSYIVERLARDGWRVRALARRPAESSWLERFGAEVRAGDILGASALADAAAGCDAIFHAAAAIGPRGDWEPYRLGNVQGTSNVLEAAERAGARLVHVSSTAVYGGDTRWRHQPTDEMVDLPPIPESDPYARSKLEAERLVLAAASSGRLWATVVRPPPMYGCRDRQLIPRIAPILERGIFPLIARGHSTLTIVHAGSVADGAVRAVTVDAALGRAYNLTNDGALTVAEFVRLAAVGLGRRILTPTVPYAVGRAAMKTLAMALTLIGRAHLAPHTIGLLDLVTRDNPFSSERARRELGWTPTVSHAHAVPEAFRWWKAHHGSAKART
ncbi:MAG: NAD-dependent epimerase/dehydratase family protein [Gemmatimonadaceae bacterium]